MITEIINKLKTQSIEHDFLQNDLSMLSVKSDIWSCNRYFVTEWNSFSAFLCPEYDKIVWHKSRMFLVIFISCLYYI